jgi:hypothetical protein
VEGCVVFQTRTFFLRRRYILTDISPSLATWYLLVSHESETDVPKHTAFYHVSA